MQDSNAIARVGAVLLYALIHLAGCGSDDASAPMSESDGSMDDTGSETDQSPDELVFEVPDCGERLIADGTALRRWPYLQDVQTESSRIIWTTTGDSVGRVEFATASEGPWTQVDGADEHFSMERTGDAVAYTAWEARLEGLQPGRTYCYRVLADEAVVASGLTFTTAWRSDERPVRILALGDSGTGSDEQKGVRDQFMNREYDLFLHLGDMAYGSGTFVEFEEKMFAIYADLLHRVPSWPTMGNHEFKTERGQPYLDVYYLPEQTLKPDDNERYYSFDYGDIHFVSLDSNDLILGLIALDEISEVPRSDDMIDWLRQDLAASSAQWKIVFFHHPPYTSSSSREPSGLVRGLVMPVLEEFGVDLVLSGHDHFYERSIPIWNDAPAAAESDEGITYIVAGFGGTGMTEVVDGNWHTAAAHDDSQGFVDITINGCIADGTVITGDGDTVDSFRINGCED